MTVGESIPDGNANTGVVGRRRAKRGNGLQLRAEIMDVAERLLVEKGDQDAVSIRSIADVIGITPPSVICISPIKMSCSTQFAIAVFLINPHPLELPTKC